MWPTDFETERQVIYKLMVIAKSQLVISVY